MNRAIRDICFSVALIIRSVMVNGNYARKKYWCRHGYNWYQVLFTAQ